MNDSLKKQLQIFGKLKRGNTKYGPAPHKPVLLISVLQAFRHNLFIENKISITPEIVYLFKSNWSRLIHTGHVCNFALPFFHLSKEKGNFWHLFPNPGFETSIIVKESISSIGELNTAVDFAYLSNDLYLLMKNERTNYLLQQYLMDEYFSDSNLDYSKFLDEQQKLFGEIENKILKEDAETYRSEIKELIANNKEEEIFIRGSLFKREVPKIYNNTCCISGMRIDASINISMVDACHIVPFSESYDDTITNGIALCPNLHRAFDRGLIGIDNEYRVVISGVFKEYENNYSIRKFEGQRINLPAQKNYYPQIRNLEWHLDKTFKL